jgi:hypothetical protein
MTFDELLKIYQSYKNTQAAELDYYKAQKQDIQWRRITDPPSPADIPDDFDVWVEEVRKQNRLEELVTAVYKKVMDSKLPE